MQDDKTPRSADPQTGKRSRELPASTLWLRNNDEGTPGEPVENDPANSRDKPEGAQGKPVPVAANEDGKSAEVGPMPAVKAEAAQSEPAKTVPANTGAVKQKPQVAQPTSAAHVTALADSTPLALSTQVTEQATAASAAPRVPDLPGTKYADERPHDVSGRTTPDRQTVANDREAVTGIARGDSGFFAWPSTAGEPRLIERPFFTTERPLLTPLLGAAALVGLVLAAWSYTALEDTRAQLTSITNAKAAVDQSLADAQRRLEAAEKAIADVQTALGKPTGAALKAAPPKP
jgi:hypothetical protein